MATAASARHRAAAAEAPDAERDDDAAAGEDDANLDVGELSSFDDDLAAGALAVLQQGGAASYRCLDARCPAVCSACRAPPAAAEERKYELVGDVGRRNGERKLRSLLAQTPQWRDNDERERTAALLEAAGEQNARCAAALRTRRNLDLRKGDMLQACACHFPGGPS